MRKAFLFIISVVVFGVATSTQAQTLTKDAILQNSGGNRVTLGTPASVTNNKILLPGTLGSQGAILIISSVASTTGTTAWLNPGSNGDVLTLSGGIPTWSAPSGGGGGTGWGLTGNSGTTAGTNFIGTTDAIDWVVKTNSGGTGGERIRVDVEGQVGIGNIQPKVMMDIKGGLATRSGVVTLSNGNNNNVYIGDTSYVRIAGLTAAGTITGIRNGYDGKFLTVFNTTDQTLKFSHNSSSSIDTTRILNVIGQGGDVVVEDSGMVDMRYDGSMQRWIITNVRGGMSATSNGTAYFVRKTTDTTNSNNASLRVADELTLTLKPNIVHTLDGMLYFKNTTSGNPALKIGFITTQAATLMKITALGHDDGGTNTVKGSDILDVSGGASANFDLNSGTEQFIHISGIIINGSTAGELKFGFRPNANGDQITLKAGSYIRLIPVGSN